MKDFKDLGITYKPKDGKKRFDGDLVRLGDIQNCEIVVHDFETGITTKEGDDRYIVQFEFNNERKKFITNSEEMKDILNQVREMNALPFKATIKREVFGQGKNKYVFT